MIQLTGGFLITSASATWNSSILDGWWLEAFNGNNGWALGGEEQADRDAKDAAVIYDILEKEVVPLYYKVNGEGVPVDWVKLIKAAMKSTGPVFSVRRMVKKYSRKFYQPALQAAAK
jgi:starch phosphorylase